MATTPQDLIRVHSEWLGWQSAEIAIAQLTDVHWRQPTGAPRYLLHGFIDCRAIITGDIPHDCDGHDGHRLLVCVLKHHVPTSLYTELTRQAPSCPQTQLETRNLRRRYRRAV